jgi:hypothetical protein
MSLSRPAGDAGPGPGLPAWPMSTFPLGPRRVRRSGYGAMQLAGPWAVNAPPDRASAVGVLRAAVAGGIDHIDTASPPSTWRWTTRPSANWLASGHDPPSVRTWPTTCSAGRA